MNNTDLELVRYQLERVVALLPNDGVGTIVHMVTGGIRSPTVRSLAVALIEDAFNEDWLIDTSSRDAPDDTWDGYLVVEHPSKGSILVETIHARKPVNHGAQQTIGFNPLFLC